MDLSVYDKFYDTDEVSVTSTAPSEPPSDGTYLVDTILSEGLFPQDDGTEVTRWLVKWTGYEPHHCTWEPEENITKILLEAWQTKKQAMNNDEFEEYCNNIDEQLETANARYEDARAIKLKKRAKKRLKLVQAGKVTKGSETDSDDDKPLAIHAGEQSLLAPDSDDDAPIRRKRKSTKNISGSTNTTQSRDRVNKRISSLFVAEKRKHLRRSHVEDQSSSNSSSDSAVDSGDSVLGEAISKSKQQDLNQQKKTQSEKLGRSTQEGHTKQKGKDSAVSASTQAPKSINSGTLPANRRTGKPGGHESIVAPAASAAAKSRKAIVEETQSAASRPTTLPTSPAANSNPPAKAYKTKIPAAPQSANPIKMINKPKVPVRRDWNTTDKHFTTLKFRAVAEKRGRREGTPDLGALQFVNGVPEGLSTITPRGGLLGRASESPYGRREPGNTRLQDLGGDEEPNTGANSTAALRPFEHDKIPLVCFDWRNRSCSFTPDNCRFLHRMEDPAGNPYNFGPWDGAVPPKFADPPQTCFFWLRGPKGCHKSTDECMYAHENTGWLLRLDEKGNHTIERINSEEYPGRTYQPKSVTCWYWLMSPTGCSKSAENCKYAHTNTGTLKKAREYGSEPIDPNLMPVFKDDRLKSPVSTAQDASTRPAKSCATEVPEAIQISKALKLRRKPPGKLTCYFWYRAKCMRTAEECPYQHCYTGTVADPPNTIAQHRKQSLASPRSTGSIQSTVYEPKQTASFGDGSTVEPTIHDDSVVLFSPEQDSLFCSPPPRIESAQSYPTCAELKHSIEDTCKLNFSEMFSFNYEQDSNTSLDKRAFLLFHPEDHIEELELITRWLLMHHVVIYSFWSDGAWESFKDPIVKGGTGVVIAHPDFQCWADIPNFGEILRSKVRVWSVGVQEEAGYDPQISTFAPALQYDCIEIFPHGGFVYVTDDVFKKKPAEALNIFRLFFLKIQQCRRVAGPIDTWKRVNDGCLLWRLGVRPDLMQALFELCERHEADIEQQNPLYVSLLKLYELLSVAKYIEQDDHEPYCPRPDDYFPVISERFAVMEEHYYSALATSQSLANTKMIEYFGGMLLERRREYRQYFVVHTDAHGDEAEGWKSRIQNIDEVMSPEEFIEEFEGGKRFEFYDRAFRVKDRADSTLSRSSSS